jgi:hypothetical protein
MEESAQEKDSSWRRFNEKGYPSFWRNNKITQNEFAIETKAALRSGKS